MSKKRCLMVGVGGMANVWIRQFWQPFLDRVEFSALVDVNQETLDNAGEFLGVPAAARFTSTREAFEKADADFCCIVTPPAFHQEAVELACARKMDILSEKPIADTWQACCDIYRAVNSAGIKMLVTQNYRYNVNILTLKKAIGELGRRQLRGRSLRLGLSRAQLVGQVPPRDSAHAFGGRRHSSPRPDSQSDKRQLPDHYGLRMASRPCARRQREVCGQRFIRWRTVQPVCDADG
jgi:hypothetical protein